MWLPRHLFDLGADDVPISRSRLPVRAVPEILGAVLGQSTDDRRRLYRQAPSVPPKDVHRVAGIKHQPHHDAKRLRPLGGWPKGRRGPIVRSHQRTHFPAAAHKTRRSTLSPLGGLPVVIFFIHFASRDARSWENYSAGRCAPKCMDADLTPMPLIQVKLSPPLRVSR